MIDGGTYSLLTLMLLWLLNTGGLLLSGELWILDEGIS